MSPFSINHLCDVIFKLLDQYKCKQILVLLTNDGGACDHTKCRARVIRPLGDYRFYSQWAELRQFYL
jgi:hypothetical protein